MNLPSSFLQSKGSARTRARLPLSIMLIAAAYLFTCYIVGSRSIDVGTDTQSYVILFLKLRQNIVETRIEPGFVLFTRVLGYLGINVFAYQAALFSMLLLTVVVSSRKYFHFLGEKRDYLTYLTASLACMFLSPIFVNASINLLRQGLASLLIFTALMAFYKRQWWQYLLYAVLASSIHYSSLMYLALAPLLLLSLPRLRILAVLAFVSYCSGFSQYIVKHELPALYTFIMEYSVNATYRRGTRIDFAIFSCFWYVLPWVVAPFVQKSAATKIKESTIVYLVLLLPFFAIGFGNFSNRYLFPAWLTASLLVAALVFKSRIVMLRSPIFLGFVLLLSCAVFFYYIENNIII